MSTTISSSKTFSQRSGLLQLNMSEEVMIASLLSCGALIGIVISSIIPPSWILRVIGFFISFGIKSFWIAAVAILVAELTSSKQRTIVSSLPKAVDEQEEETETQTSEVSSQSTPEVARHVKPVASIEMQQRKNHNVTQSMPPLPKLPLPGLETPTSEQVVLMTRKKSSGKSAEPKVNTSEEVDRVVFHPQPSPGGEQSSSLVKSKVDAFEHNRVGTESTDKKPMQEIITLKPSATDDKVSAFEVLGSNTQKNNETNESHHYDPDWSHEKDDVTFKSYGSEITPAAQEEMNSLRGRLQNLYTIIRQYKQQVNQFNTRLHGKDTQIADIIRSKHEAVAHANQQISDFQRKLDEAARNSQALSVNIRNLESQNRQLKEEIRIMQQRLQDATARVPALHEEDEVVGGVDGLLSPIRAPHVYESLVDDEDTDI